MGAIGAKPESMNTPTLHSSPSVIVVNDDLTQLSLIAALVEQERFTVHPFSDAESALGALSQGLLPDLIISDLHMPGIDGWRFCRLLRSPEYKAFNQTPLLVVSATFSGDYAHQITADLGANAFIPAPFDAVRFKQTIQALLAGEVPADLTTVLIVDDHRDLAQLLQKSFENHGFKAYCAATGAEGETAFRLHRPQVTVVDFHLPDLAGDQLLREFKRLNPMAVVIMMTADASPALAVQFMRAGAAAYLQKPFSPEYLLTLCGQASRERALLNTEDLLELRTRELRQSEEKYRTLFENHLFAMCLAETCSLRLLEVNDAYARLHGYSREDLCAGITLAELAVDPAPVGELIAAQAPSGRITLPTHFHKRKNGIVFPVEVTGGVCELNGRQVLALITQDVAERQAAQEARTQLENQLRQAQKMEAIGTLAGGIAHDFNNILCAIIGNAELGLRDVSPGHPAQEHFDQIRQAGQRAADRVRQILTFSRQQEQQQQILQLPALVMSYLQSLRAMLPATVNVVSDLASNCPAILGDPGQIQLVVVNLCTNAIHALPEPGGRMTIGVAAVEVDAELVRTYPELRPGRYACLSIQDNGRGMSPVTIERMFEPFFTTKPFGQGTGLGLAVVHGIVKSHNASITVRSNPNEGTDVRVYFPACEANAPTPSQESPDVRAALPASVQTDPPASGS